MSIQNKFREKKLQICSKSTKITTTRAAAAA